MVGTWEFNKNDSLYAFNGKTREKLWAIPINGWMYHGTAVSDLDNDGIPELVIGSYNDTLYCVNGSDGMIKWKYAGHGAIASPAIIADLDNDGRCEIIFNSWIYLTVLNDDGVMKWEKYIPGFSFSFRGPVAADINNDDYLDLIIGSYSGVIGALNGKDGSTLFSLNLATHYGNSKFDLNHGALIADFDNDGDLDVFIVGGHGEYPDIEKGYGRAYALSIDKGRGPDWLMFQRDPRRQSSLCYDYDVSTRIEEKRPVDVIVYPNPSSGHITIEGDFEKAQVTIYNAMGQLLQTNEIIGGKSSIDVKSSGFHIMKISFANKVITKKLVVYSN